MIYFLLIIKFGIDFYTAQGLWNDSDLIEIPANTSDEPRYLVIVDMLHYLKEVDS
jgi:uncharacterized DUF497 family protein